MYKIIFSKFAQRNLEEIGASDQKLALRLITAIESLQDYPEKGKLLKFDLKGMFSLRVGTYRVVYKIVRNELIIHIIDVAHRKHVYKEK